MDARSLGNLGVCLAFFVVWVAGFCEGNHRIPDEASYGNGVRWRAHDIDENTADQVSVLRRKQLEQITEAIKYFKLNLPYLTSYNTNSDVALRKKLARKAIVGQPSKLKQSLLHCLKSKRSLSDDLHKERWQEFLSRPSGYNGRILKPRYRRRRGRRRRRRRRRRPRGWPFVPPAVPLPAPPPAFISPPPPAFISPPQPFTSPPTPILTPIAVPPPALTPNGVPPPALTPNGVPSPTPTPNGAPSSTPTPNGAPSSTTTPNGAPSPTLTPNGAPSSTPTPIGAPSSTPTPNGPPSSTPTPNGPPSPISTPKPEPLPKPSSKPLPDVDPRSQDKTEKPPALLPDDDSKERKLLIISVASTTVAAFSILLLFLICFLRLKKQRRETNDGRRDAKLLATGTLQRSKKVGSTQDVIHSLSTKDASMPGDQVSGVGSLPLPPGKTAPPSSSPSLSPSSPPSPPSPPFPPSPSSPSSPSPPLPPSSPPPPPPPPAPPAPSPPEAPPPPPPMKAAIVPNPPKNKPPPPAGLHHRGNSGDETNQAGDSDCHKTKLKPFFWDKVSTSPNRSMVWHEIKTGSFQFNEEMMENLFGYSSTGQNKNEGGRNPPNLQSQPKLIQIIEPKKAQNLAILLKALNVTTQEVIDALKEGNELPVEFISTLLKMAPTQEEELKLRSYSGNIALLGPSERFLKVLVDIPFAFKRLESLLFMGSLQEESSSVKESFSTLEVACMTLRKSRLFLKLLEAVLKTGNRMNVGTYRGGAQAFKLDTLLKLSDVKGTDGKTTLLSFVVQEIIRSEGTKAARRAKASQSSSEDVTPEYYRRLGLEVVSKLSEELEDIKKAALIDGDILTSTVLKLGHMLQKTKDFVNNEMKTVDGDTKFETFLTDFVERAEAEINWLLEEEKRIMALVKSTGDYFHGKSRKDEGLHLFVVVRDFLVLLDSICNDIRKTTAMQTKHNQSNSNSSSTTSTTDATSALKARREKLFPSNNDDQSSFSSSDEEGSSP